jgi:hypothetical protein
MKKGDIVIPSVSKVSTCGTIIFQAGYEYSITDVVYDKIVMIFIDSEWGVWVIDQFELEEKFKLISLRQRKLKEILMFLNDGN